MTMTEKIVYTVYDLGRLIRLAQKLREQYATQFPTNSLLIALVAKLDEAIAVGLKAVNSTTKQTLTEQVQFADVARDDSYFSLREHVKAGLKRQNETYSEACKALWAILQKNGLQLYKLPYDNETTAIDSLMSDLNTDEMKAHLETIHATDWLAELVRDNATFVAKQTERGTVRSEDTTALDTVAFRQVRAMLELTCSTLDTMLSLDSVDGLAAAVAATNQYIHEANVAGRQIEAAGKTEEIVS